MTKIHRSQSDCGAMIIWQETTECTSGRKPHNKIVFVVAKNPENGKYMIISYRLSVENGREWVLIWGAYHEQQNTPEITVLVNNQAADYEEWMRMAEEGVCKPGHLGLDYTLL